MVDTKGLITTTRGDTLPEHKRSVARSDGTPDLPVCCVLLYWCMLVNNHHQCLLDVIKHVKPTSLIGLSGSGPAFFEAEVQALCEGCALPLIFPLSNPTSKAEISAEDAYAWSEGRCIFASGMVG